MRIQPFFSCLLTVFLMSGLLSGPAVSAEINLQTRVNKITLYTDGAQVTRTGSAPVPAGEGKLIIELPETPIKRKTVSVTVAGRHVTTDQVGVRVRCRRTTEIDAVTTSRLALMANVMSGRQTESGESYGLHACTVSVPVIAQAAETVDVAVGYTMPNAGWRNMYTAELDENEQTLSLRREARAWQLGSETWEDVNVTLSWASIQEPGVERRAGTTQEMPIGNQNPTASAATSGRQQGGPVPPTRAHEAFSLQNRRQIPENYTLDGARLAGRGEIQNLLIGTYAMPARLGAEVRPGKPSILTVEGRYQGDEDLPPGLVAIEGGGKYHSANWVRMLRTGDRFSLVLAEDEKITCVYLNEPVSDIYKPQLQNSPYQVSIQLENHHRVPVDIQLIEALAIPLAQDNSVTTTSASPFRREGQLNEKLVWYDSIDANQVKQYSYTVSLD